jgi:hypothetical protein
MFTLIRYYKYNCYLFFSQNTSENQLTIAKVNISKAIPGDSVWYSRPYIFFALRKKYSKPYTGCPRVAKKLHNLFVIKDINFFFFLDDSYASTADSENIAVYIQSVPIL